MTFEVRPGARQHHPSDEPRRRLDAASSRLISPTDDRVRHRGLIFTIAFGALVIWALHGITVGFGADGAKRIADIAGGVIVRGLAVLIHRPRQRTAGHGRVARAHGASGSWTSTSR